MELRIAARRLLSDPWAAGAAIMAAALGAGLNTAVFAVAYGVLLRPLPYAHADRLVFIEVGAALSRVAGWRRHPAAFDRGAGYARAPLTRRGAASPAIAFDRSADVRRFQLAGRLRPGVSLAQARDDVARAGVAVETPGDRQEGVSRRVASLEGDLTRAVRPVLIAFAVAGAIVLIVACSNVASILIGRTASRQREI